jgi:DNA invertase Pin-like site-specific DNA recombinase
VKQEGRPDKRLPPIEVARTKLRGYRLLKEQLHVTVVEAYDADMIPAEIARESGLSRQWVAKILRDAGRITKDED